jgi:hypothetical protein
MVAVGHGPLIVGIGRGVLEKNSVYNHVFFGYSGLHAKFQNLKTTRPQRGLGTQKTHLVLDPNSPQPQKTDKISEFRVLGNFLFFPFSFQVLK